MVSEKVKAIVADTMRIPAGGIALESTFQELGIGSLDAVEIVFALEEEFEISIPEEAMKGIRTVGDAVENVEKLLAEKDAQADPVGPG